MKNLLMIAVAVAGLEIRAAVPFDMPELKAFRYPDRDFRITDYGAKHDGSKCTEAFAKAMAACNEAGGGHVIVPSGEWVTGPIHFKSNCDLHLDDGAVIAFTDDPNDYLPVVHTTWEGVECLNYSPLIYAYGCENVAITGRGTLAPRMDLWRKWFVRGKAHMRATEHLYYWCSTNAPLAARNVTAIEGSNVRPHLIQMNRTRGVLLDGFHIRSSPFWMIHLYHSENCIVRNLDTFAHGHNNDGVDIEMTRNVLVENCVFDQGDDGIVLKAGRNQDAWRLARPTENVVVSNCTFKFAHTLVGIGSELSGGIRNFYMTDCRIDQSYNLLFIKTNRRRGGFVENIHIENIKTSDIRWALFGLKTDILYQWADFPDFELRYTKIRNVNVRNVHARCADWGVYIDADAHEPASGLHFENVSLESARQGFSHVVNAKDVTFNRTSIGEGEPIKWVNPVNETWHKKANVTVKGGIQIEQDRADALYRCGKEAVFRVMVADDSGSPLSSGEAKWTLDNFGSVKVAEGRADLAAGNPFTVRGKLDDPGFLRLTVKSGTNSVFGSVGYDVTAIRQTEPRPADFDEYWAGEKARLEREVPLEPSCELVERLCRRDWDTFKIGFDTFNSKRVWGFMTVPKNGEKPFRTRIRICDAGTGAISPWEANADEVTVTMSVFDFEPADDIVEQRRRIELMNAGLRSRYGLPANATYRTAGIGVSREDCFFHDAMLGINRAIDWIAARPEVDSKRIVYFGSSQGGGFGLFVNYLNSHFSKAVIAVPAITGHYGYRQNRLNGWPNIISQQPKAQREAAEKRAAYFDGVNFAAGIRIPIRFIVSLSDACCPPPQVYSAYNACPSGDKAIMNCVGAGHDGFNDWLRNNPGAPSWLDYNKWLRSPVAH